MSDNFDNNNNVFDGNAAEPENNNEFSSFPTGDNTEEENSSQNTTPDFSSGEYHFAHPKYANDDNDSQSVFSDTAAQPDSSENAQPVQSSFDNSTANNGFNDTNPYQQSATDNQGPSANYNPNVNAGPAGYTPYNWNNQNTNPNTGYNGYSGQPNNGYYGNPAQPQNNAYHQTGGYNNAPVTPPKKGKGGKIAALVVVIAVVVIAVVCVIIGTSSRVNTGVQQSTTAASAVENSGENKNGVSNSATIATTSAASTVQLSAVDVAEKVRKSVVGVMTYKNGQLSGEGSGVVMGLDSTGEYTYIITCAHVINESNVTYGVQTLDDKKYTAELVATDTRTDIGVLKVKATDLSPAEFGDSTSLKVGETVYAIGNPGGSEYFGSMTDGIISAIDRSVSSTYNITCIQHNAAINPGNSGGALVNSAGQVIGINSSKIAATDYEGMGFAIPMSTVSAVVDDLIKYQYVPNRPKLGIEYASVDRYQLYSMVVAMKELPAGSLVIAGISKDSSLANTDAQVGDMIIGVNGKPMDTSDVLLDLIDTGAVGDTLTLNLCRVDNRTYKITKFDVTITLVEDKGDTTEQEETTESSGNYDYGGAGSFEDFFNDYFGGFGGFGN
ncbi:MAG: trypsin-like peptidase domain-containing protein [Acutalibacteraceae bacterium]